MASKYIGAVSTAALMFSVQPAIAQDARLAIDIQAQTLDQALTTLADQTGLNIVFVSADVRSIRVNGLRGSFTRTEALSRLLEGTGYTYRMGSDNSVTLEKVPAAQGALQLGTVRVEGATTTGNAGRGFTSQENFGDAPAEAGGFKADFQSTATKTPLTIRETPQALSVVTRDAMDTRQVQSLENAVELSSGIAYTSIPNPGVFGGQGVRHYGNSFLLRGQLLSPDRDIRTDGFSTGNASNIDMAAYDRVEVVRGPSGFYGQGSLGGFINQVRRKPQAQFAASVEGRAGSYDTYRVEGDVTGAMVPDERLKGRLTVAYDSAGAFVEHVESQRVFIAPSIESVIDDKTRVLFQALYQDEDFIPNPGIPTFLRNGRLEAPNIARELFVGLPGDIKSHAKALEASVRVDRKLSDRWLMTLQLQGNHIARDARFASYAYGLATNGDVYMYTQRITVDQDRWAGELRVDGRFNAFGREHVLIMGVEANQLDGHRRQGYTYLGTANIYAEDFAAAGTNADVGLWRTDRTYVFDNRAAYVQAVFSLSDRTRLLAGIRHDQAERKDKTFYLGTSEGTLGYSRQAQTARIGLSHDFTPNISGYATWGQSFNPIADRSRNGLLEPERGHGYEVGLKTEWFDNNLAVNLSVYKQDLKNRALRDPTNGPGERYSISAGLHRNNGIELEVSGSPLPGLTLAGAVNISDNEFVDPKDTYYGLSIHGSIDRQHSLFAGYEWQKGALKGFGIGSTWVHVGERKYIRGTTQIYGDGYDRVDLNLSYKGIEGIEVALLVRNVFDDTYLETSGYPSVGSYFGSPRAALLRVKKTFH